MRLLVREFSLPLRHPFTTAHGTLAEKKNLLVQLRDTAGLTGCGEAAPSLAYPQHSAAAILAALEHARPLIERGDFTTPEELWQRVQPALAAQPFALAAVDMAAHDLWARRLGVPVWQAWGLTLARVPESNFTIGLDTTARMVAKLAEVEREGGWPLYKIKLGGSDDLAAVRALRAVTGKPFRVDANTGWTAEQALALIPELAALGVEFIEQPLKVDDWRGMERLFAESPLPLIADESCHTEADVERCARCFHGINVKLTKCGGFTPARRMIARARSLGLRVMAGCMIENSIAISALAQLLPLLDDVDMDGAALLAGDIADGVRVERGRAIFPAAPGLGVTLHAAAES